MRQKAHQGESRETAKRYAFVKVLYEDRELIVVEKPAGLHAVAPPEGKAVTIVDQVHAYLRRRYTSARASYVKPLHRLDRETSGVMVLAKSRVGEQLAEALRRHAITRRYLAIVAGRVNRNAGTINAPLEKGEFGHGKKVRIAEGDGGQEAITHYRVRERYRDATLLEIEVKTGRTHQIRVHLASIGHPLVGDKLYGHGATFSRHALHATLLGFRHPVTGKKMEFRSPLPPDLRQLVDILRGD